MDNEVGAAAESGDGDIMMRFVPANLTVVFMRQGQSPRNASVNAIKRIIKHYSHFSGVIVAVNKRGEHSAACYGLDSFTYSYRGKNDSKAMTRTVGCVRRTK